MKTVSGVNASIDSGFYSFRQRNTSYLNHDSREFFFASGEPLRPCRAAVITDDADVRSLTG